jgi:hypothetical protein
MPIPAIKRKIRRVARLRRKINDCRRYYVATISIICYEELRARGAPKTWVETEMLFMQLRASFQE